MKITYLILITLFITACDYPQVNSKDAARDEYKKEFKECMNYIPERTVLYTYKDWDEVIESCKKLASVSSQNHVENCQGKQ